MMVRLVPMNKEEFHASLERGVSRVAVDNVDRGLWSRAAATGYSRSEFAKLLPKGQKTPGFTFVKALDQASGERVGEAWYSLDHDGGRPRFWVHWIEVDPPFRRRGNATWILEELARRARKAGSDRIGLHVQADNSSAIEFYKKIGFAPTSLRMAKKLM